MEFQISPRKILRSLLLSVALLTIANLVGVAARTIPGHGSYGFLIRLFDFNTEKNIPTLFSSVGLLASGALLAGIALQHKAIRTPWRAWMGLSVIMTVLAIDETAQFHERLVGPMQNTLNVSGMMYFVWIIPYLSFIGLLGLAYFKFLARLPGRTRLFFLLSGAIYIFGAAGFEILGNLQAWSDLSDTTLQYRLLYTLEELFEMIGIVLFIYSLFDYMTTRFKEVSVRLSQLKNRPASDGSFTVRRVQ